MNEADRRYRPDIDGLRAIAVLAVLIFHAFPASLPGGFVGVDVFFVISGYLISGIILSAIAGGRFTYANFYARRIRRIFPALAMLLGTLLVAGWFLLYADDYARLGYHAAAGAAFVSNLAFWREASYFDAAAELKPLLHLWSLGIEEQFYLVWPVILVLASRWRRGALAMTFLIGTVSFLVAIWTVRIDRTAAFYAPWNRFWELLAGAALASIEADAVLAAWLRRLVSRSSHAHLASITGFALIAAGVVLIDASRVFPGLWVLLPVAGTALLIVAGPSAWVNRLVLSRSPVVFVGLISYPLYLWHWPLLSFARIVEGGDSVPAVRVALLAVSVVLAWATYLAIERPIRFGPVGRVAVPALAVVMTAMCAVAVAIYSSGGMIERHINRSDAARLVDFYDRMRKTGIADAYRRECDFMDWDTEHTREAIDPSCTAKGQSRTLMLWGDSFAQALSLGISESLPAGASLAQVATSACPPQIDHFDLSVRERRCEKTNQFALQSIEQLRPELVLVALSGGHAVVDWKAITSRILALGAAHVVVVGPAPVWRPSLPRIFAEHHMQDHAEYVGTGLELDRFKTDRLLAARMSGLAHVTYLSLLDQLCRNSACLARVPGEGELDLMALDFGHLTPQGSSYLGHVVWKPYLDRVMR